MHGGDMTLRRLRLDLPALIGAALKKSAKPLSIEEICPRALTKVNHGALCSAPPGLIPARPREALSFPRMPPLASRSPQQAFYHAGQSLRTTTG